MQGIRFIEEAFQSIVIAEAATAVATAVTTAVAATVTTSETAATALAEAATAATKAALLETAAFGLGLRFVHFEFTTLYFLIVQVGDSCTGSLIVVHFHKAEAFAAATHFVFEDFCAAYSTIL